MKNAWITFADNEIYLKSAYALALSLDKVKSIYPLVVMIPAGDISKKQIFQDFIFHIKDLSVIIKKVPYLYFNFLKEYWQSVTINKFHAFSCIEFDKVCFIDADSYFIKNLDYIFELPIPAIGEYLNDKKEFCVSTGIFIIKPNLDFYSLLLNLCITMNFFDDENVFYYLSQENDILKFNTYFTRDNIPIKEGLIQEQKREKFWSNFSYEEIKLLVVLNGEQLLKQYLLE